MMTKQTVPIYVEVSEQPADEEEAEKLQDQELTWQIEKMVEVMDMELEQE